jgi:hypothetical protein
MDTKLAVMRGDLLNPAQRSSLTLGLRAFEKDLRQADAWLLGGEEHGCLYRRSLDLAPERRAAARVQIAGALAQIAALAERFDLAVTEDDLGATIASQMSVDWANLCDTRSNKLRRYGEVDPRLAEFLDADVDALAQLALSLTALQRDEQAP